MSITSSAASNCSAGSASYQCECSDFCGPAHLNSGIVDGGTSLISYDDIEVLQLKTSGIPVGNQLDLDNDGVCLFDEVYGCDDLSACNYDDAVTELDDSCTYPENHIPSDYCFPDFESCASDYIDSFQTEGAILNIENLNSGCSNGQYTYYDEHSLVVTSGSIINYSLTAGSFGQYFSIALDANQNGSFESSEFLFIKTDSRVTNFSDIIEIPDGIEPGSYRMRVQNWYYELALANLDCPFGDFGNVQDYDLVVIEPPVSGCAGDLNGDGIVSSTDLSTFLSTFGTSCED